MRLAPLLAIAITLLAFCTTMPAVAQFNSDTRTSAVSTIAEGFTDIAAGLEGLTDTGAAWGDYDADGDLDLFLTGRNHGFGGFADVYNNDDGQFTRLNLSTYPLCDGAGAWGDYDRDGDLDLMISGRYCGHPSSAYMHLFLNTDGNLVREPLTMPKSNDGTMEWGDYDNDGDLDLLLLGAVPLLVYPISSRALVLRNDEGQFVDAHAGLPSVLDGSAEWGDYDNDGDLDIVIVGAISPETGGREGVAHVFRNTGASFEDIGAPLQPVELGTASWADYDSDGDLDILLAGYVRPPHQATTLLYVNDNGAFRESGVDFVDLYGGNTTWADYDSDGDLDALVTGHEIGVVDTVAELYETREGSMFPIPSSIIGTSSGAVEWADFDGDSDLDVLVTGAEGPLWYDPNYGYYYENVTRLYRNDSAPANLLPTSPGGLASTFDGEYAHLSWSPASDPETPAESLTYNIWIGTSPDREDVFPSMSDHATGFRRVVARGNAEHNLSWSIQILEPGTYYWSVQAVDAAFAGGPFAESQSFVVDQSVKIEPVPKTAMARTRLIGASPNPFNPSTAITFELAQPGYAKVEVFDVAGRLVTTLFDGFASDGPHDATWTGLDHTGRAVAAGVYHCRLTADSFVDTTSLVLVK